MHRIDTPSRAESLHGNGKHGFKGGNPSTGEAATQLDADWFNAAQETLLHPIEAAGLTPQKGDHSQLTQAIRALSSTAHVRQPRNVTPAAGATQVGEVPTLTGSAYYSLYGIPQGSARFEISQSETFASILHTGLVNSATTSYTVPSGVLSPSSVYFWRVAYKDAEGNWSLPSAPTGFTTGAVFQYIAQPSITAPANNASGVSTTPTITYSAFSVLGGADTHNATQVQIASDEAFTSVIHDSGIGQPGTAYTVPTNAALPTLYILYVRVRHRGANLGWSQWSPSIRFQVQAKPAAPVNLSPANGATNVPLGGPLQTSSFAVPGSSDTHVATQWQIASDAAFTAILHDSGDSSSLLSYTIPPSANLPALTTCYWRARHKGGSTGYGNWSAVTSYATASPSGSQAWTTPGTYNFQVPPGVYEVSAVTVGAGAGGGGDGRSGGGGGLRWGTFSVNPGDIIPITVGDSAAGVSGQSSSFGALMTAYGGAFGGAGGGGTGGQGGGTGGSGVTAGQGNFPGGGGAAGYDGNGGAGGVSGAAAGSGGGGGGGNARVGGGGVGIFGKGTNGAADGGGGSGGGGGSAQTGGSYGGGGPVDFAGGNGAVRVIWGPGRSYPNNAA
ncbi:hypothetical protein [Azospirillum sp. SYSU D00513]|uniref:hypothetical protein n=1 Tax=Azospirillum sp. SYSU D00513 TaxID=2812561 RepID=UPI001A9627E1|nr:hypothetical protein [Azospirillum sp. SYSU D00513]